MFDPTIGASAYDEACDEFNSFVPDWQARLAVADGTVLLASDFPVYDEAADADLPTDEDWGWYREQVFAD